MSHTVRCDRCGVEREFSRAPNHPPSGWEDVCGADLCEKCSVKLHEFLRGESAINLNDRVWIKRNGELESFQLWDLMHRYGPALHIASAPPFDGNWIYILESAKLPPAPGVQP